MKSQETRRYEMLKRVRDFGAARAAAFPAPTLGQELFTVVAAVVAELESHAASQTSGLNAAVGGTTTKALIREDLRDALAAINRTARSLAYETPGLDDKFRLPRSSNDQALLSAARAFAADAAPMVSAFVRYELPENFLADLQAQIDAFEATLSQRATAKGTHVAATAAIDAALSRGLVAARQLDAIVRNKLRDDPAALAAWATASHTERTPRSAPAATPEPPKS